MSLYRNGHRIATINPEIMTIAQAEQLEELGYDIY